MKVPPDSYAFRHPEAQALADLLIVRQGIRRAHELIQPLCIGTNIANLGLDETEMHWTTAVIRYTRVFPYGGGVLRWDYEGALARLDDADRETHRYTGDLRSGYFAHSVGTFEDAVPTVGVERENPAWTVTGFGSIVSRIAGPGSVEAAKFSRLTANLLVVVDDMIDAEERRLVPIAQALGKAYFPEEPNVFPARNILRHAPRKPRKKFSS